jgi:cysteine dioxygenase
VHLGPSYAALVLCWRPGQASPIHDHLGSACALRVIQGTGTETRFHRRADGTLVEGGTHTYECHRVCGTYDADIHTLHIYTPPMRQYRIYARDSTEYVVRDDLEILTEMRRQGLAAGVRGA